MELVIENRAYQQEAVDFLSRRRRGMIVAPAGSGKTLIAASALNRVILAKPRCAIVKVGWLANTREQIQQAHDAIARFPEMLPLIEFKPACAAAAADWSDRDVLIVDENHHSPAPGWLAQIKSCSGVRWGFTATPGEDSTRLSMIRDLFGEIHVISRNAVIGKIAEASVFTLNASDADAAANIDRETDVLIQHRQRFWKGERWQLEANAKWQAAIKFGIVENQARTSLAISTAISHAKDHVLLLVNQIEHGQAMTGRIPGARLAYSKMGTVKRRDALAAFKSGDCPCLVATSLADEGFDAPIANVLVLVCGGRSNARTEQRTGRVLRVTESKRSSLIYDFEDSFHPFLNGQFKTRRRLYEKLGYSVHAGRGAEIFRFPK